MRIAPEELHSGCIGPDSRLPGHPRVQPLGSRSITRVSVVTRQIFNDTLNRYLFRQEILCRLDRLSYPVQDRHTRVPSSARRIRSLYRFQVTGCVNPVTDRIPAALRICPP
jgi:hypothetical protein